MVQDGTDLRRPQQLQRRLGLMEPALHALDQLVRLVHRNLRGADGLPEGSPAAVSHELGLTRVAQRLDEWMVAFTEVLSPLAGQGDARAAQLLKRLDEVIRTRGQLLPDVSFEDDAGSGAEAAKDQAVNAT